MDLEEFLKINKDKLDVQSPVENHFLRFEQKLSKQKPIKNYFLKAMISITASILVFITISFALFNDKEHEIPQELAESQQYFNTIINKQLKQLKAQENTKSKIIIDDTIKELKVLENEYNQLLIELNTSENQQLIIDLLIQNFQQRIALLKQVTQETKNLKNTHYETI